LDEYYTFCRGRQARSFRPQSGNTSTTNSLRNHERGQVLPLFCITMFVLTGIVALAVDVGTRWNERLQMQTAACRI